MGKKKVGTTVIGDTLPAGSYFTEDVLFLVGCSGFCFICGYLWVKTHVKEKQQGLKRGDAGLALWLHSALGDDLGSWDHPGPLRFLPGALLKGCCGDGGSQLSKPSAQFGIQ